MEDVLDITGAKGGGKGGSSAGAQVSQGGYEAPNTLRSKAKARIAMLLGEGPIDGLGDDGAKNIFLDGTPLQNADGSFNFQGVTWEERIGIADQAHLTGIPQIETAVAVGVKITAPIPIVRTINAPDADAVRIILNVPALAQADAQGNTFGSAVSFQVDVRPAGGGWEPALIDSIVGKTTSQFQTARRIPLPLDGNPWDIRVTRLTPDATDTKIANELHWDSFVILTEGKYTYPNSAVLAIEIDAQQFGSSIPAVTAKVKGLNRIQVPTNYDPVNRTYAGIWDGTFKLAQTNNPAWFLYHLLTQDRYGLGDVIDATKIDKWGLYTVAQYCDQYVPSGFKWPDGSDKMEPRFIYNNVLNSRQDAYRALQDITGAFRGMMYWSLGQAFAVADMPIDPVALVAPANVIGGTFHYSGTSLKARHTVALVSWNDPEDQYRPAIEIVQDNDAIAKFGWRPVEVQHVGCTSRGQAHRYGKWILDTEQNETETCTWEASFDQANIKPGDIVLVADPRKAQVRTGGRLKAVNNPAGTFTIDSVFVPELGNSYSLSVVLPSNKVETFPITGINGDQVATVSAFSEVPQVDAMWVISGTDVNPRRFRVLTVDETDKHTFKITALFHDPTKYARVEYGIVLDPIAYTRRPKTIKPPTNLQASESLYYKDGLPRSRVSLSWSPGEDFLSSSFNVTGMGPFGFTAFGSTVATSIDLGELAPGDWTFYVVAVAHGGAPTSAPAEVDLTVTGWAGVSGPSVINLRSADGGTIFVGRDPYILWDVSWPPNVVPYECDFVVRVFDPNTDALLRTEIIKDKHYTYDFGKNRNDGGPRRSMRFRVSARSNNGVESTPAGLTLTNPVPAPIIPNILTTPSTVFVTYNKPEDADFEGVQIWIEANGQPRSGAPEYDGSDTFISFPMAPGSYDLFIAGYDAFGKDGLNITGPIDVIVADFPIDTSAPAIPVLTNAHITSEIEKLDDGTVQTLVKLDFPDVTSENLGGYEVEIKEGTGAYISFPTAQSSYQWRGIKQGRVLTLRARSVSKGGFVSGYSSPVATHTVLQNNTPPGDVTNVTVTAAFQTAFVKFTPPTDTDLETVEIWRATVNDRAQATLVASDISGSVSVTGLTTGTTYYFWLRAKNTSGVYGNWTAVSSVTPGGLGAPDFTQLVRPIEIVNALPTTGNFDGRTVYLTTDKKLYRYNGTTSAFTAAVAGADVSNIPVSAFAAGIRPVEILSALPTSGNVEGRTVYLTTDKKLYRYNGGAFTVEVDGGDIKARSITAASVAAGTITASEIYLPTLSENLLYNGHPDERDLGTAGWALHEGSSSSSQPLTIATSGVPSGMGPRAIRISKGSASEGVGYGSRTFPVQAGKTYRIRGKIAASGATTSGCYLRVVWRNSFTTDGIITNANRAGLTDFISNGPFSTAPVSVDTTWVAPAGAVCASIVVYNWQANSHVDAFFDELAVECFGPATLIRPGSIMADSLVANSITANLIAAGAITADKLAAGSVTAGAIAAGAITADKLAVGNFTNMATNGAFEVGTDGMTAWTDISSGGGDAYVELNSANARSGKNVLVLHRFGSGVGAIRGPLIDVVGGTPYELTAWISPSEANKNFYLRFRCTDKDGNSQGDQGFNPINIPNTGWQKIGGLVTLPAATRRVEIELHNYLDGAAYCYVDSVFMRDSIGSTVIENGAITTNHITVGTLNGDRISVGTLDAAAIKANTVLSNTVVVGSETLATIAARASDPAARINAMTTVIGPGKIQLSGGTTLTSWISGGDNTKIEGGAIAANTITANKLRIGARGLSFLGLDFQVNKATGTISWSAGYILWENDAGNAQSVQITANAMTLAAGSYIYWTQGENFLRATNDWPTAILANNVLMASYNGGAGLIVNYGGTIIDGTRIITGTITATQIAAGTIQADRIAGGTITSAQIASDTILAVNIAANAITAKHIGAGSITADKISVGQSSANLILQGGFEFFDATKPAAQQITGWYWGSSRTEAYSGSAQTGHTYWMGDYANDGTASVVCHKAYFGGHNVNDYAYIQGPYKANVGWDPVPVTGGATYEVSGWFNPGELQNVYLAVNFYSDKAVSNYLGTGGGPKLMTSGGWQKVSFLVTAPVNARYALVYAGVLAGAYCVYTHIDDVRLARAVGNTSIEGGAITTDKIQAGAITAGKITVAALDGNGNVAQKVVGANQINIAAIDVNGNLADWSVINSKIWPGQVNSVSIADGSITANKLVSNEAIITTAHIHNLAVDTIKVAGGAISNSAYTGGDVGSGGYLSVGMVLRSGNRVRINVTVDDPNQYSYRLSVSAGSAYSQFHIQVDGTIYKYYYPLHSVVSAAINGPFVYYGQKLQSASFDMDINGLPEGYHIFYAVNDGAYSCTMSISVTELAR